jgi:hypothetical protein
MCPRQSIGRVRRFGVNFGGADYFFYFCQDRRYTEIWVYWALEKRLCGPRAQLPFFAIRKGRSGEEGRGAAAVNFDAL